MNELEKKLDEKYYFEYIINNERMWRYEFHESQYEDIKKTYRDWFNDLKEKIQNLPETFPEIESDLFDSGLQTMKANILKLL